MLRKVGFIELSSVKEVSSTLELERRRLRTKRLMLLTGMRHFFVMEPALSTQQTLLATLEMGSILSLTLPVMVLTTHATRKSEYLLQLMFKTSWCLLSNCIVSGSYE